MKEQIYISSRPMLERISEREAGRSWGSVLKFEADLSS